MILHSIAPFITISRTLPMGVCILCAACSFLLYSTPNKLRARNILATLLLLLALSYIPAIYGIMTNQYHLGTSLVLNPYVLIASNLFATILTLYPLDVIRPGWLNGQRALKAGIPFLLVSMTYIVGCMLSREPIERIADTTQLYQHLSEFNVWGRFIIFADILFYLGSSVRFVIRHSKSYKEWCENNFSSIDNVSINWLKGFMIGILILASIFFASLLTANPLIIVIYQCSLIISVVVMTQKALQQHSAYPSKFFASSLNEEEAIDLSTQKERKKLGIVIQEENVAKASNFDNTIKELAEEIRLWFENEKPYRRSGFMLSDVAERIPKCRTYLSRIFNDGLGDSFSHIVKNYRIRDAEIMLIEHLDKSIADIAEDCGFSNPTSFNRTFSSMHDGMTPGQYRNIYKPQQNIDEESILEEN
ncbi:MAG: helix-turn-helix domain-containing protein [Prevotella sp.]|nr:helix-turn-helix domain-containing protein [Bacteroides sp.]MCM1366354.1 helix-turn-helix domain-containing protein [Prevotella sp.]